MEHNINAWSELMERAHGTTMYCRLDTSEYPIGPPHPPTFLAYTYPPTPPGGRQKIRKSAGDQPASPKRQPDQVANQGQPER